MHTGGKCHPQKKLVTKSLTWHQPWISSTKVLSACEFIPSERSCKTMRKKNSKRSIESPVELWSTGLFSEEEGYALDPHHQGFFRHHFFTLKLSIFIAMVAAISVGVVAVIGGVYSTNLLR